MWKIIVFAIGILLIPFTGIVFAADGGAVAGTIKDSKGRPVSNAKVSIEGKSDFTDDEGQYRIKGIKAGKYKLQVKKGKEQLEEPVEIKDTIMKKDLLLKQIK